MAKDSATKPNWASATGSATAISAASRVRAPMSGTIDWISASASASTSA